MKKRLVLLLVVLLTIISIVPVYGKEKNFYAGESVELEKPIHETTFAAGNNVKVRSQIDGISFVAGRNVDMTNTQDYALVAGEKIKLYEFSAKDVFVAGKNIKIKDATIRNIYATGESILLNAQVGNDVYLAGEKVTINSAIAGDVKVACDELIIEDDTLIGGTLKYPEEATAKISESATVANVKTYKGDTKDSDSNELVDSITSWMVSFLSMLLIALILMAFNKKFYKRITETGKTVKDTIFLGLKGLAFLIVVPLVAIFALIAVVTIPLSIIVLIVYGILLYLSIIPTSYYFGNMILKNKIKNEYLLLIVSLFGLYILKSLPYIGGIVSFLSLIIGLGIFFVLIKEKYTEKTK